MDPHQIVAQTGILLFAHGARDPAWRLPFEAMHESVREQNPQVPTTLAYLELMQPSFADGVTELVGQGVNAITVAPLFLAAGSHLKRDLPELVAQAKQAHAGLSFTVLPPLGEAQAIRTAVVNWLTATL